MDVHSKYPGVAVAFKSRQACQSILNDVMRHLSRMLRDGSIDDDEYKKMRTMSIRPVSYEPGVEIIREAEDSSIIVTHSGIVKVRKSHTGLQTYHCERVRFASCICLPLWCSI